MGCDVLKEYLDNIAALNRVSEDLGHPPLNQVGG
jgi:hypothetical protein